eukprot:3593733-Rhodomonas_salina.1
MSAQFAQCGKRFAVVDSGRDKKPPFACSLRQNGWLRCLFVFDCALSRSLSASPPKSKTRKRISGAH